MVSMGSVGFILLMSLLYNVPIISSEPVGRNHQVVPVLGPWKITWPVYRDSGAVQLPTSKEGIRHTERPGISAGNMERKCHRIFQERSVLILEFFFLKTFSCFLVSCRMLWCSAIFKNKLSDIISKTLLTASCYSGSRECFAPYVAWYISVTLVFSLRCLKGDNSYR